MTRRIVYGISAWIFVAAMCCTIASIALPNWISYSSPTDTDPIRVTLGLQKRCSSITGNCTPFPSDEECEINSNKSFCSMWRSSAFLMNFTVVIELAVIVCYIVVLAGGRGAREVGWKVLSPLLALIAVAQLTAMAIVAYLYDHDNRFFVGWELDKSWILCTVSWIALLIDAAGILAAAFVLVPEDDYEEIPEPR
ncbi:hypothetical protein LTR95_014106 [Oleoguttula sp. CCFEE 5521]